MAKHTVVVLDDDEFYLASWRQALANSVDLKCFDDPFLLHSFLKKSDLSKISLMIIDYKLNGTNAGEINLAATIRKLGYKNRLMMCSLLKNFGEYDSLIRDHFDGFLKKKVYNFSEITKYLSQNPYPS